MAARYRSDGTGPFQRKLLKGGMKLNNRMFVFAGSALLVLGLFVPIVQLPIIGSVSIFADGTNLFAYALLALAGVAAFTASKDQTQDAIWPGACAAALVIVLFVDFQISINRMKANLAESMEGNPFGGLASGMMEAIQLQWGWIVLAAAVALMLYGAVQERKAGKGASEIEKLAKIGSFVLLAIGIGWLIYKSDVFKSDESSVADTAAAENPFMSPVAEAEPETNAEAQLYMAENVEVYDVSGRYEDSMLDGRVPGVDFKVRNNGDRSLDRVQVTVVFYDAEGNAIAEEDYLPVLAGGFNNDKPLRPGYIWQQERGRFYTAKSVPDEWESGKVSASVTEIEFSPDN